jgi:hypothetical protein
VQLVWRVKLVAELRPGVMMESEVARIERDEHAGPPQHPQDFECSQRSLAGATWLRPNTSQFRLYSAVGGPNVGLGCTSRA